MSKSYSSTKLTALVIAGAVAVCTPQYANAVEGHDAKIRPGFMATNSDQPSDFFLDMLFPLTGSESSFFYLNPHVRADDEDGREINIGLGYRTLFSGDSAIFGFNAFYDRMDSPSNNNFSQWGIGFELLKEWYDLRANYYQPFSGMQDAPGLTTYSFTSTSLIAHAGQEEALEGFDAEVGVMIPGISNTFETRAFLGIYRYKSDLVVTDPEGWRGRLEVKLSKLIHLEVEHRSDDVLGDVNFFGGYLEIPFSFDKGFSDVAAFGTGARTLKERMTQKVVRDRHIVILGGGSESPPHESIEGNMIYVNEDNSGGDGSLEDPYESFDDAQNDEDWSSPDDDGIPTIVYVFSWEGESGDRYEADGADHNGPIQLRDEMVLWGEGYYHPVYGLGGTGSKSNSDMNPILDGEGMSYVVGLADDNEVMGFDIRDAGDGIYGNSDGEGGPVYNTNIHDNYLYDLDNPTSGIHIENNFSSDDYFDGEGTESMDFIFKDNIIDIDHDATGIYLKNKWDSKSALYDIVVNTTFTGNEITGSNVDGEGILVKNELETDGTDDDIRWITISNTFTNNTISGFWKGIKAENKVKTKGYSSVADEITLSNTFTDNDISRNVDGEGKTEAIKGKNEVKTEDNYNTVDYVTGTNTFTNNTVNAGFKDGIKGENKVETKDYRSDVDETIFSNVFIDNDVAGNAYGEGTGIKGKNEIKTDDDNGDVYDTTFSNIFTGNTARGYKEGIKAENKIEIKYDDNYQEIWNADITNTFDNNTVYNNEKDGIIVKDEFKTEGDYSDIDATVTNTFTDNTVYGNNSDGGEGGIYVKLKGETKDYSGDVDITATNHFTGNDIDYAYGGGIYIKMENKEDSNGSGDFTSEVFMEYNTVQGEGYGGAAVTLEDSEDDVDFNNNLGSGGIGDVSSGNNTFDGDDDYDLVNDTGEDVSADNNDWGSDVMIDDVDGGTTTY